MLFGGGKKYKELSGKLAAIGHDVDVARIKTAEKAQMNPFACGDALIRAHELGVEADWDMMLAYVLAGKDPVAAVEQAALDHEIVIHTDTAGESLKLVCGNGEPIAVAVEIVYKPPVRYGSLDAFPWHAQVVDAVRAHGAAIPSAGDFDSRKDTIAGSIAEDLQGHVPQLRSIRFVPVP